jgi:hypothetical protein
MVAPDDGQWTVHPLVAGLLLGWVFTGGTFALMYDWWWAVAGGGVGFAAGWCFASFARRVERSAQQVKRDKTP